MGAYGRSHARRPAATVGDDGPRTETIPPIARCSRCDTPVILVGGKLPSNWSEIDCEAICPDCTPNALREAAEALRRDPKPATPSRSIQARHRHIDIGPKGVRYTGCRFGAEIVHSMASLEFRAGGSPPPRGRDDRVQFLLDRAGLEQLELEIRSIRNSLPKGKTNG